MTCSRMSERSRSSALRYAGTSATISPTASSARSSSRSCSASRSVKIASSGFTPRSLSLRAIVGGTQRPGPKLGLRTQCAEGVRGRLLCPEHGQRRTMSENETSNGAPSRIRRTTGAARSGLDVMLTEASEGGPPRFLAPRPTVKVGAGLARHPRRVAARATGLTAELARAATGRSKLEPAKGDRRFSDPAWEQNWLLHRLLQGYLAVGETVDGLISDADVDWRSERLTRLAAGNVLDALAPTNFAWSNPTVMKETVNTGGANLVRGARRLLNDLSTPPRLPATVDTSNFEVGGNLAASPGSVVLRTDVFELIQYKPSTGQVREVPLLFIPPTINKYYILDIAPGRSMIEHFVAQGQQVFAISWRNPEHAQGHLDLDTYAEAVSEARDAVASIAAVNQIHLAAACSGGIIASGLVGGLAADRELDGVASLTLMVCALDNESEGTVPAL